MTKAQSIVMAAQLAWVAGCASVDSDSPEKKRQTASPYYSSPEVTSIPIKTCPETFTTQEPIEPELCPWLMSFDLIALATIESRTTASAYAVETETARRIQQPVKELGLDALFPWVDSAAATGDPIMVVESCPVGVSASLDAWRLTVSLVPSLVVGIHIDTVLHGTASDKFTNFYVGWEQRSHWGGPEPSDQGEWVGSQFAPGSVVGLPLTYDRSGEKLLLAGEQPFVIDGDGRIRMNSISCLPLVPRAFNGTTPANLKQQLEGCSADESAGLAGHEMREARLSSVSTPLQFPPTAAYCNISFVEP
jgi:hypothetical protein